MNKKRSNKGITLIALILTVIVLLILAGVSINMVIGENGLISKSTSAVNKYKMAEIKEKIELNIATSMMKKNGGILSMDDIFKGLIEEGITTEIDCDKENGQIITKEGYVVKINLSDNGKYEVIIKDIIDNIIIEPSTTDWAQSVKINVIWPSNEKGVTKEISIDGGKNYTTYVGEIEITNNCQIIARIRKESEVLRTAVLNVDKIDKEIPSATIEFSGVTFGYNLKVNSSDTGGSGINLSKCKYTLNPSVSPLGINEELYNKNIDSETMNITLGSTSGTYYVHVLVKDNANNAKEIVSSNSVTIASSKNFPYTGGEQSITLPKGKYKIECWGAQGGSMNGYIGGKGAYTKGNIILQKITPLYIYVGGGNSTTVNGGYNGGGSLTDGQTAYGRAGGGATDIRLDNSGVLQFNSLKTRIMVAAGGGGANNRGEGYGDGNGGAGGALIGIAGVSVNHTNGYGYGYGNGGTQTSGGSSSTYNEAYNYPGKFGQGAGVSMGYYTQSAGGSGYYGGAASAHGGAGGGSSFISGYDGCNAISKDSTESNITHTGQSVHYSGLYFTEGTMIAGNTSMPSTNGSTETGHSGNGYARITNIN